MFTWKVAPITIHDSMHLLVTLSSAFTWCFWYKHVQIPTTEPTCRCFDGASPAARWSCRIAPVWMWCLSTLLPQRTVALLLSAHSTNIHCDQIDFGLTSKANPPSSATTHVLRNNQPLRLPTGRAYASVARGLHPATQESLWSFKCNITDTIIHKTCVTAISQGFSLKDCTYLFLKTCIPRTNPSRHKRS